MKTSTTLRFGRLKAIGTLSLALLTISPAASRAADIFWSGGTGDYTNAAAWGGTVPGGGDHAINNSGSNNIVQINPGDPNWTLVDLIAGNANDTSGAFVQNGGTVKVGNPGGWMRLGVSPGSLGLYTLNSGTLNSIDQLHVAEEGIAVLNINGGLLSKSGGQFSLGDGPAGCSGTVNQSGGVVNSSSEIWVGNNGNGNGTYNLSGGSITNSNWFAVGRFGGRGKLVVSGGSITKNGGGNFYVGENGGTSQFDFSGGTISCDNEFWLGNGGGSIATNNMSGTATITVNNWIAIGRGGIGVLNLSSGSVTKTGGGNIVIPGSGTGIINQTGGAFTNTTSEVWLPENGTGTWNLNGGFAVLGVVHICQNGGSTGNFNVNGGVLSAFEITGNAGGNSTLSLNGGTLRVGINNANLIHDLTQASIGAAGITFDSAGFNATIAQSLNNNGGGGLTKIGAGSITLNGANSYTGPTVVNSGKLATTTASSGGGSYTVASGAELSVQVASGNGQLNAASLTLASPATTLDFDLNNFGNPSFAPLNVVGSLAVNGTNTINILDAVPQVGPQFPLIKYGTKTGTGTFVLGTLPLGVTANLVDNVGNGSIDLVITSVNLPRWDGQAGGNWDVGLTTNWINIGTGLPTFFGQGNAVLFDDNALGATTVNLVTTVNPSSVIINNTTLPYTVIGTGKISGSIGLSKQGAGTLAILNTGGNNYTGPTVITSGTLSVTNLANGGSPSPIGASSASPGNLVISNATFGYGGSPVSVNRGYTIAAPNSTIEAQGNLTFGGIAAATPGSSMMKSGPAQLGYAAVGVNELSGGSNPGYHVVDGTVLFDGSAGGQTNHTQQELWVAGTPITGASMVLSNTILRIDSWIGVGRGNGSVNNTSTVSLYNSTLQTGNASLGYANNIAGYLASQFLTLNGNSLFTNRGDMNLAESSGATSIININGTSLLWSQNRCFLGLSDVTTCFMTIADSGRMVVNNGWCSIGNGSGSIGGLLIKNNGSLAVSSDLNVTDVGAGTADLTAQDNAQIFANNLFVGKGGSSVGTFTITNNAAVVSGNGLTIASGAGASGTVTLSGGSLAVNLVQGLPGSATFNFNGGRLIAKSPFAANFMFNMAAINVMSGGAIIDSDTNNIAISEPLLDAGGGGGLVKLGTGTLRLNGVNTYTGTTFVTAGTLGGTGTILGPVSVASSATLAPGASIGTLTINNALSLAAGSSTIMEVSLDGGVTNNDQVIGLTSVGYGGTLTVTNAGLAPLAIGNVFKLFASASPGSGNFSQVTILPAGTGTFNPTTGELTITSAGTLTINPAVISNGNLILGGTGGSAGGPYTWLTSTNISAPVSAWTTNTLGNFDGSGNFSNAMTINRAEASRFFRLRVP